MKKQERIVCAAIAHLDGENFVNAAVTIVPINMLAMDVLNKGNFRGFTMFVTSYGFVIRPEAAADIAIAAGQIDQLRTPGILCETDLFPELLNK